MTVEARPARLATTNITNWKLEQQEDLVLYQAVKHRRASREVFKEALLKVTDRKAVSAYVKSKDQLVMKNGLLYQQSKLGQTGETVLNLLFLRSIGMWLLMGDTVRQPTKVRAAPYHSCKSDSGGLAQPVTSETRIRKCGRCKKFEAAPPMAPLMPLACSGPRELLHVDFTSIEETVPLCKEPVIRNVMVMQDHFSRYVVAYVVKDQMACTATETLRNGYFGLFGAPAYLVSDQGKVFTGHLITNLCELYGVQKL